MDLIKIIGIALCTVIASIITKQLKPELAIFLTLAGSVLIVIMCLSAFTSVFSFFDTIIEKTGVDKQFFVIILKIIGVGYVTEFANGVCVDSGHNALGDKILFASKLTILFLSFPIIENLLSTIIGVLP